MSARIKTALSVAAGLGAIVAVSVPANAALKGHTEPTHASFTTATGAANSAGHAARPSVAAAHTAHQLRTGDTCSAYSDGHGDFCLWYLSNYNGSRTGFLRDDANLADDTFVGGGSGVGQTVTNNAESDWNYDQYTGVYVATSANYAGFRGYVGPSSGGNFNSTYKDNVESMYWAS